jgi:hypothetical protein
MGRERSIACFPNRPMEANTQVFIQRYEANRVASEAEWWRSTPEDNLECQAMELNADSTAARVVVHTVKSLVSSPNQLLPESC